jgi:RNA polymerase sigma-70 factor (ECF subfamily)
LSNETTFNDIEFDNLFRDYYKSLRAYAFRYVGDLFAAEDIVQDVFFQLWEKRNQLHKINSIRSYLFTSVFNSATNYSKHKKIKDLYQNHSKSSFSEIDAYYHQQISDVTESILALELEQRITEVINNFPEQCKNVFFLSREKGLKNQEIADKLGVSIKAVEKQITKALMILREKLKDYLVLILAFLSLKI